MLSFQICKCIWAESLNPQAQLHEIKWPANTQSDSACYCVLVNTSIPKHTHINQSSMYNYVVFPLSYTTHIHTHSCTTSCHAIYTNLKLHTYKSKYKYTNANTAENALLEKWRFEIIYTRSFSVGIQPL